MLKGVFTAIITPFNEDGSIDEETFRGLIEEQIRAGVAGIAPCGSTGESSTLNFEEHKRIIEIAAKQIRGRCKLIAGTGSNSTREAVELTRHARETGADYSLQIVPYYNKPSQKGLFEHFRTIAEAVDIPIILYNIQGRTAVNLETGTLLELAKLKNIVGVKEGSGNILQIMAVIRQAPEGFSVLSGDDNLTFLLMAAGGHGVISVASNIIPERMIRFAGMGLENDFSGMREEHYRLEALFAGLATETNPIPVKKMMALKGKIKPVYRLPLCEPSERTTGILADLIEKYQI